MIVTTRQLTAQELRDEIERIESLLDHDIVAVVTEVYVREENHTSQSVTFSLPLDI